MIGTKDKGFTLIELVVVMAVFLLIIGVAVAILLSVIQQQRRILSQQELLNQVSYAMEHMSKALRMAEIDINGFCINEGSSYMLTEKGIRFKNATDNGDCEEFYLDLDRDSGKNILKEKKNFGNGAPLISEKFTINSLKFIIVYNNLPATSTQPGLSQPRVVISLDIQSGEASQKIQTTISMRNLNAQ